MPQQNMSPKLGSSSSPTVNSAINNSKNVQQPVPVQSATKAAYNKHPISVKSTK